MINQTSQPKAVQRVFFVETKKQMAGSPEGKWRGFTPLGGTDLKRLQLLHCESHRTSFARMQTALTLRLTSSRHVEWTVEVWRRKMNGFVCSIRSTWLVIWQKCVIPALKGSTVQRPNLKALLTLKALGLERWAHVLRRPVNCAIWKVSGK